MKKEKFVFIIGILFLIISINMISAQQFSIDWFYQEMTESFASIFGPIFNVDTSDEFLFAKILLFILLFSIVFMVLKKIEIFKRNKAVQTTVSVIVGIFAVRYLKPNEIVNAILLPYGAFGAAITIFLPLLIFFMFLHTAGIGSFGRRAGWFIYGATFLILWAMRESSDMGTANWFYALGLGFVIISLLFDSTVHEYFELGKHNKARRDLHKERYADLMDKYNKAVHAGLTDIAEDLKEKLEDLARKM